MNLQKFAPFQESFTDENVQHFKQTKRPDLVIPCMRMNKLIQLEDFLKISGIYLMKGPPGSGKTTMADLFEFYLSLKDKNIRCIRINVTNVHNMKELYHVFADGGNTLENLINPHKQQNTYVLIDEAHVIYGDEEGAEFEYFWKIMKQVAESYPKTYIKFLFCAIYSDNRIKGKNMKKSPLVLQDKCVGLNFLNFSKDEYKEVISYYRMTPMNTIFPITQEIEELLWEETVGFPQLTLKTILYLKENFNNSEDKTCSKVHEVLYSQRFEKDVIYTLKAFPHDLFKDFTYEDKLFLRNIHLQGSININHLIEPDLYDVAKKLEHLGIIYEGLAYEFKFPSPSLSSSFFDYFFYDSSDIKIPTDILKTMNKVQLAITAIERMKFTNLINVSKEKKDKTGKAAPSEDQWVIEFFIALRSFLDKKHTIHSQCSKYIDKEYIGEVDLYINGVLNQPFEATREGSQIILHLLRKYMNIYPDFLKDYEKKVTSRYRFPQYEKYLVIDFRKGTKFRKMTSFIVKNDKGESIDLGPLMKKDLMRVCYSDFSNIQIYYEEKLVKTIPITP